MRDAPIEGVKNALLCMQRHSWEQGVAAQAFLELGDLPTAFALARESVWRALPDGRAAMIGAADGVTDPCAVGEALLRAARATGDAELDAACGALLDWALRGAPRNAGGVVYHLNTSSQFWVDSMYMLPPFLAAAGHYSEALVNLYGYWEALYNPRAKLMRHMWDDENKRFVRGAHWGVGNGWALAALARTVGLLPQSCAGDKARLASMARELLGGVLAHIRGDGAFHNIVDDVDSFVEVNLSQMAAYTIFRGVAGGWLDSAYLRAAHSMRAAALRRVDGHGRVRGVCAAPHFDRPGVAPEGQAFFLLMEAARTAG